ncbi:hypothetical protein Lepto7376_2288 [[Leptolyngbya] sp. PCC 7376]|uniref:hypothetical protein n=1 Tax=[Leptolyngbya] sp. PCC 7376 TaxID=111781 RepID=UPI00029F0732|nr:hypothetical protein [[Leptolyngbya] sp. PCC 7376]AFY38578.1 hypothetical protein Lepto7376_2288 [[Leptolyngbya] sp. PCC 7376]
MNTTSFQKASKARKTQQTVNVKPPELVPSSWINGFGVVSLVTCSTIIASGYSSQHQAQAALHDAQSHGIAEAGVARIFSKLIQQQNRGLLTKNFDTTASVDEWSTGSLSCGATMTAPGSVPTDLFGGTVQNGSYRLVAYKYDANLQQGTFVVEGTVNGSTSRLEVTRNINLAGAGQGNACPSIARNLRDSVATNMAS